MSAESKEQVDPRAWIEVVSEPSAQGELESAYHEAGSRDGSAIDNILAVHSLNPRSLLDHLELYKTIMHRSSGLSRIEREVIAVVVSTLNECHY